ncbi:MAG: S41 family peptidase [Leptospiraceae bacterium]|nr:S41 family peptidase [Leptospiraceae bacterium]MCB1303864.1 S41 family peptidase [Leptospiraceae bacterium]
MKKERILWMAAVGLLLSGYFFRPLYSEQSNLDERYRLTLEMILQSIKGNYVEKIDDQTLLLGAIRGMMAATGDPYTRFLDPEETADFSRAEGGALVGIGVEVTMCQNVPCIIAPIDGSPAARAGIKPQDRIIAIDGVSTENKSFAEILRIMTGEAGSTVTLKVERKNSLEPLEFKIARAVVEIDYCRGEILPGDIGYIRLSQFFGEDSGTVDTFRKWIDTFDKKKVRGVVLDLRNNSGGHLEMAVTLASMFLSPGQVVVTARGRERGQETVYKVKEAETRLSASIPVVVLINGGSASASEILAGALQDHKRAVLVGETSFGKGSVQNIFRPLPGNTSALITTQKYFTPNDRSIHGIGLTPDIKAGDWEPSMEDRYFTYLAKTSGFLDSFVKSHANLNTETLKQFRAETKKRNLRLSDEASLILLRSQYVDTLIPRPGLDPQLDRAIQYIKK